MSKSDNESALEIPAPLITVAMILHLLKWGVFAAILMYFWSDYVLITFAELWGYEGVSAEGLSKVWFIFAWGTIATIVIVAGGGRRLSYTSRSVLFARGIWASLNAGVFEEIIYRWLVFVSAMVTIPFLNFITLGLVKWLYVQILIPVANFTTLGTLEPFLYHPESWVFGAALISACASFREQHEYLGAFGMINSWFMGMVFFWLTLNYGLPTAIVAHVVYDVCVFSISALSTERLRWPMRSWARSFR